MELSKAQSITSWILQLVAAAILFVLSQLHPSLLFRNTTPSGGDMGE